MTRASSVQWMLYDGDNGNIGFQSRTFIWGPTPGQAVPGAHEEWAPEAAFGGWPWCGGLWGPPQGGRMREGGGIPVVVVGNSSWDKGETGVTVHRDQDS
ncbi:hypothetical protein ACOMHN_008175 [Nucella lapillus]